MILFDGLSMNIYEVLIRNLERDEIKLNTMSAKAKLLLEEKR